MEIAGAKGHAHLGAISERTRLAVAVTDILIQRGDTGIVRKLSQNQGAIFRSRLCDIGQARRDENLGVRLDMPPQLLQDLISKATETVRARLLTAVPPDRQATIQNILAAVSDKVLRTATGPRDFSRAIARIDKMQSTGQLNDQAIARCRPIRGTDRRSRPDVYDAGRPDRTADAEHAARRHPRCLQGPPS